MLDAGRGSDTCSLQPDYPPRRTSVPQNAAAGPEGGQHVLVLLTSDSLTKAEGVMQVEVQKRSVCSDPLAKLNGSQTHVPYVRGKLY